MKHRMSGSSLLLLELTLAALILSLCVAVCTNLFARSMRISEQSAAVTGAVFAAESAAETFKKIPDIHRLAEVLGGEVDEGNVLVVPYDRDWEQKGEQSYSLHLVAIQETRYLQRVQIWVSDDRSTLFTLKVACYVPGGDS